ncbi:hypothetical protein [Hyphococcus sp.]|uniref:hypothetical protein n=1 Tax=Hyphococcus sp. TaxID=2038636 RepID=UPI0035C6DCDC
MPDFVQWKKDIEDLRDAIKVEWARVDEPMSTAERADYKKALLDDMSKLGNMMREYNDAKQIASK